MSLEKLLKRIPLSLTALFLSCGSENGQSGEGAGCTSDYDCKGERICSSGQCVTLEERNQNNNPYTSPNDDPTCYPECSDDSCKDDGCGGICGQDCGEWGEVQGICNEVDIHCCYGSACTAGGSCDGFTLSGYEDDCFPSLTKSNETLLFYDDFEDKEKSIAQWNDIFDSSYLKHICEEGGNRSFCINAADTGVAGLVTTAFGNLEKSGNNQWAGYSLKFRARTDQATIYLLLMVGSLPQENNHVFYLNDMWGNDFSNSQWTDYEISYKKDPNLYVSYTYQDGDLLSADYGLATFGGAGYSLENFKLKWPLGLMLGCEDGLKCFIDDIKLTGFN